MISFYNDGGKLTLEPGEFHIEGGGCVPSKRGQELVAPKPVTATFNVILSAATLAPHASAGENL